MGSEFTGVDKVLTIRLEGSGRELELRYLDKLDSLQFTWEKYSCGSIDTYESQPITIGELFSLLTMKANGAEVIAGKIVQRELAELREQLGTMKDKMTKLEAANQVLLSEKRTLTKAFGLLSPQEGEWKDTHRS